MENCMLFRMARLVQMKTWTADALTVVGCNVFNISYAWSFHDFHEKEMIRDKGDKKAKDVRTDVILHPEVVSRLNDSYMSSVMPDDLQPGIWTGIKGNATQEG